jgi:hypothetical protein
MEIDMFADTITFTDIHGTGTTMVLNRVNQDKYSSEYRLITDTKRVTLFIRNTTRFDKAASLSYDRHNVELTEVIYPVSPSVVATTRKAYFTFEVQQGDELVSAIETAAGLLYWGIASSNASLTKLAAFES